MKSYLKENDKEEEYKEYSQQFMKFNIFIGYVVITFLLDCHEYFNIYHFGGSKDAISIIRNIIECTMLPIICGIFCIKRSNIRDIKSILCCKCKKNKNENYNLLFTSELVSNN